MKYSSINRILLSLTCFLYGTGIVIGQSGTHFRAAVTLLAMGALLNVFAIWILGTDVSMVEHMPSNPRRRFYAWLYGSLGLTVAAIVYFAPPVSDRPDKSGMLALVAVVAIALIVLSASIIHKRTAARMKMIEERVFEGVKRQDSFFKMVRFGLIAGRLDIPEYTARRRWFMTFATAVLVVAPYFGFLAGLAMEYLTPVVKATQAAVPVPKWMIAIPFMLPILTVLLLPTLFFYYLIGLIKLENREKSDARAELKAAHDMQTGLMPTADPVIAGYDISGLSKASEEVGGDYFDYLWMNEEKTKLGIAIADVSGKAMKAAITAVMTSGMIYREIGGNQSPKEILKKINTPMFLKTQKNTFTAMSIAVIDTKAKTLTLSNAGQTHPILKRGEETRFLKVEGTHYPLGIIEEVEYQELTVPLQSGDVIVFYTDGIAEATNANKELFGFDRLEQKIKQMTNETAKEAIQAIVGEAEKFAGSAKQHDDMTVVILKVV
jgi:serine phosphatase RsbU (regulator of sigma subunit)